MPRSLDEIVSLPPATGWIRLDRDAAWIFVPADEKELASAFDGSDHMSVYVHVVGERPTADETISALMRRRVRQGEPEKLDLKFALDASRLECLGWTDGVSDIVSYFALAPTSEVVEFQVSHTWRKSCNIGPCPSVHEIARLALAPLSWR